MCFLVLSNITFAIFIIVPVGFALRRQFESIYIVRSIAVCVTTLLSVIILYAPKFYKIYREGHDGKMYGKQMSNTFSTANAETTYVDLCI